MLLKPVTFGRRRAQAAAGDASKRSDNPSDNPSGAGQTKGTDKVVMREGWLLQLQNLEAKLEAFEAIPDERSM